MKNVDYSWGKDFARIKQSIRDWDYRNLSLFSKTNLNNIWMARDIIEITTCMQDTTVIRFDMRSTNKTKVMFNQKLVSRSGYISSSKSFEITCTVIENRR